MSGRRILTLALVVLSVITVVGMIFAPQIMGLYLSFSKAPDRQQQIELGAYLLRWFMPQIVFYGIGAIAGGLLTAHRRFAPPMFTPILNNLVAIVAFLGYAFVASGSTPSVSDITSGEKLILGAGTTLGVVAMTAALWPSLRSLGFRWRLTGGWNHPAVRRLVKLSAWVIVYVVANQIAFLVVNLLAGGIGEARFQIYATAFIIFSLPHAIFGVSIFTALLPGMASQWTEGNRDGVVTLLSRGIRDTTVVIVPAALAYLAIATPIVALLLQYGEAKPVDTELIARTLQGFAIGLPFFSIFQLLTRTFYAMQDSRTPALINIGAAFVMMGVDIVLVSTIGWDVPALALGHAASYAFATAVGLIVLRPRLGSLDGAHIWGTIARVIPAADRHGGRGQARGGRCRERCRHPGRDRAGGPGGCRDHRGTRRLPDRGAHVAHRRGRRGQGRSPKEVPLMKRALQLHGDQRGLVGKMMIVWLLLVAVLAVGAIDAGSIALTKFKLSSVAVEAASDGAVAYRNGADAEGACLAAQATVTATQPDLHMGRNFCEVNPTTGQVTITLRTTAGTILAGRVEFTKHYTIVVQTETNGPSGV